MAAYMLMNNCGAYTLPTWSTCGSNYSAIWNGGSASTTCNYRTINTSYPNPYFGSATATYGGTSTQWVKQAIVWYQNNMTDLTAAVASNGWVVYGDSRQVTPAERIREIIRARQAPMHLPSHRKLISPTEDARELRARATFRRIVGEHNWRSYCGRGYISVRAASGKVYQIFAGHDVTRVYDNGKLIERLCVVLNGDYPPSDSILMRYVLILSDEATFRRLANKTVVTGDRRDTVREGVGPTSDLVTEWIKIRGTERKWLAGVAA